MDPLVSTYRESREWVLRCLNRDAVDLREYFNRYGSSMGSNRFYSYAKLSGWEPTREQLAIAAYLTTGLALGCCLEEDFCNTNDHSTMLSVNALGTAMLHPSTANSPMLRAMHRVLEEEKNYHQGEGVSEPREDFTEKMFSSLMEQIHPEYQISHEVEAMWRKPVEYGRGYICWGADWENVLSLNSLDQLGERIDATLVGQYLARAHILCMLTPSKSGDGGEIRRQNLQLFSSMLPREERMPGSRLCEENLDYIESVKRESQRNRGSRFAFIDEALLPHVMAITPRKLNEFISLAREYNMEWAIASYDWGDDLSMTTRREEGPRE